MDGTITIVRCKVGRRRIAETPDVAGPETVDAESLVKRLSPNKHIGFMINLLSAPRGAYVGRVRSNRDGIASEGFVLQLPNDGDITWLEKRDPTWRERVLEIYRVIGKDFDYAAETVAAPDDDGAAARDAAAGEVMQASLS
jgi:hypothetical protein